MCDGTQSPLVQSDAHRAHATFQIAQGRPANAASRPSQDGSVHRQDWAGMRSCVPIDEVSAAVPCVLPSVSLPLAARAAVMMAIVKGSSRLPCTREACPVPAPSLLPASLLSPLYRDCAAFRTAALPGRVTIVPLHRWISRGRRRPLRSLLGHAQSVKGYRSGHISISSASSPWRQLVRVFGLSSSPCARLAPWRGPGRP